MARLDGNNNQLEDKCVNKQILKLKVRSKLDDEMYNSSDSKGSNSES